MQPQPNNKREWRPVKVIDDGRRAVPLTLRCHRPCPGTIVNNIHIWLTERQEIIFLGVCDYCRVFRKVTYSIAELINECPTPTEERRERCTGY